MESLITFLLPLLLVLVTGSQALKMGVGTVGHGGAPAPELHCSRTCESAHCTKAPILRYGKYCGAFYTGCENEKPCDALDDCCKIHDDCIGANNNDYLNVMCNQNMLDCIGRVDRAGPTFPGNTCDVGEVASQIKKYIEPAVLAGKILHKREVGE